MPTAAPMPTDRLLIARQLHAVLQLDIGHDIEIERLLADAHYARDVLLVCDAMRNGALSALVAQFRAASVKPGPPASGVGA